MTKATVLGFTAVQYEASGFRCFWAGCNATYFERVVVLSACLHPFFEKTHLIWPLPTPPHLHIQCIYSPGKRGGCITSFLHLFPFQCGSHIYISFCVKAWWMSRGPAGLDWAIEQIDDEKSVPLPAQILLVHPVWCFLLQYVPRSLRESKRENQAADITPSKAFANWAFLQRQTCLI